jgi:hypothetical protein
MSIPDWDTGVQALPQAVTIAVDTEFAGPHTLTVQVCTRIGPDTLVVQVYRSAAVPDPPPGFDVSAYVPTIPERYGRFCRRVIVRPVKLLGADLGPAAMLRDLYHLPAPDVLSRAEGKGLLRWLYLGDCPFPIRRPTNYVWDRRTAWRPPAIDLHVVGHFLRADFGRIHGQVFLHGIRHPHYLDQDRRLVMRS